jgi:NitT/TauT family transport system permease protein
MTVALEPPRRARRTWISRDRVTTVVAPLVVGIAFLLLWEWFVNARDIKPFLLPAPSAIWDALVEFWPNIVEAAKVTGTNALIGLVIGTVLGTGMALVAQRFRIFGEMVAPVAAAANAIPIVALATIFGRMFDSTTETPRRLVVVVVVFFPVFVNVLRGLTQVEPVHLELMRSYAARPTAVMRHVRLPNAMPFLLTGVRVAASLAVIAAVVAEYFVGVQNGLGPKIAGYAKTSNYTLAWAYVAAACALGLVFFVAASTLERVATPWQRHRRT